MDDDGPDGSSPNPSSYAQYFGDEPGADVFTAASFSDEGLQDPWLDAPEEQSQGAGAVEVSEEATGTAGSGSGHGSGLGSGSGAVDFGSFGDLALGSYTL